MTGLAIGVGLRPRAAPVTPERAAVGVGGTRGLGGGVVPLARCRGGGADGGDVSDQRSRVFIFGMGYTSLALANSLQKRGWKVAGTCRNEEKRSALELRGFRAHHFNPDDDEGCLREEALGELHESTHVLSSVPPVGDFDCDPVLATHRDALALAAGVGLRWVGYLSSTSVYGDWQGGWVDEDAEPRPVESKAVARRQAENHWLQFGDEADVCVHVFRLGGIYGPGRSALDAERSQRLSARQQLRGHKRFTSRVHVADVCQAVMNAMISGQRTGRVYNVVDDDPSPRAAVMAYARALLHDENHPAPSDDELPEESSRPASNASHLAEKRVSNRRVKQELRVQLLHPSFRSGLKAIASGSSDPFD